MHVSTESPTGERIASVENRLAAIESVLEDHAMHPAAFVDTFNQWATEEWLPENGARVVAKAWSEPDFRLRLLANGIAAIRNWVFRCPRITAIWWPLRTPRRSITSSAGRCVHVQLLR